MRTSGFFYNCYPSEIGRYFYSPEWLKIFCRGVENSAFEDGEHDAFERKDYERIAEGIQLFIDKYNISEQDANNLKDFLNKYWKMFETSKPTLVLFPRKSLNIDDTAFKDYFEEMYSYDLEDIDTEFDSSDKEIYYKIDKLLEYYRQFYMTIQSSQMSTHNIEPANLSFADLSQLMAEKDRFKLQSLKEHEIFSLNYIVKKSLEMGITKEDCLEAQRAEKSERSKEEEITIDD